MRILYIVLKALQMLPRSLFQYELFPLLFLNNILKLLANAHMIKLYRILFNIIVTNDSQLYFIFIKNGVRGLRDSTECLPCIFLIQYVKSYTFPRVLSGIFPKHRAKVSFENSQLQPLAPPPSKENMSKLLFIFCDQIFDSLASFTF